MPNPNPTHPRPLGVEPEAAARSKHTPEPWEWFSTNAGYPILAEGWGYFLYMRPHCRGVNNMEANAAHIVACVNALAGLDPEAISELVEAMEGLIHRLDAEHVGHSWAPLADAREALRRVKGEG